MGLSLKHDRSQLTPKRLLLIAGLGVWLTVLLTGDSDDVESVEETTQREVTPQIDRTKELASHRERTDAWQRLSFNVTDLERNDPFARLNDETDPNSDPVDDIAANPDSESQVSDRLAAAAEAKRIAREEQLRLLHEQQLAQRLAVVESQRIDAVFQSAGKVTALIGRRTIQEGDLLEDGVRVVRISPKGMTVSVEENPAPPTAGTGRLPESKPADDRNSFRFRELPEN